MSYKCCKGFTATCAKCGTTGCSGCNIAHSFENNSRYCNDCCHIVETEDSLNKYKKRVEYLKSLLKENNIKYDHSDNSDSEPEYTCDDDDGCKHQ
jgi:hypothetical protein